MGAFVPWNSPPTLIVDKSRLAGLYFNCMEAPIRLFTSRTMSLNATLPPRVVDTALGKKTRAGVSIPCSTADSKSTGLSRDAVGISPISQLVKMRTETKSVVLIQINGKP